MMIPLDPRLAAAASFARDGTVLADIGTDHAYLPIYLVQNGIVPPALASATRAGAPAHALGRNVPHWRAVLQARRQPAP